MTEIATINSVRRWGTSVFLENTAIFIPFIIKWCDKQILLSGSSCIIHRWGLTIMIINFLMIVDN